MDIRYQKNIDKIFSEEMQNNLLTKTIAVIGCGGQGGYILEYLARLGVKSIMYWDGDFYCESNLNRQIGCTNKTLGMSKVQVLTERLKEINPNIILLNKDWYFGEKDSDLSDIMQVDFIFYAADCYYNISSMRFLLKQVIKLGIPLIDCPVNLTGGYVRIETKNDLDHFDWTTQNLIQQATITVTPDLGQPAYKCALIAAEAVNQMVLYFYYPQYACIDTHMDIQMYHHKYIKADRFGII